MIQLMASTQIMGESVLVEATKFFNTFTEQYKTIYGLIEDVCAALLGPPALVQGGSGIYTMPVAPFLRR